MIAVWLKFFLLLSLLYFTTAFYVYNYGGPGKYLSKVTYENTIKNCLKLLQYLFFILRIESRFGLWLCK